MQRELATEITRFIYGYNRPPCRLQRDVREHFWADTEAVAISPIHLLDAFPPLTPLAAAIVDLVAQTLGWRIFLDPYSQLLEAMAVGGPIALAEALVVVFGHVSFPPPISTLIDKLSELLCEQPTVHLRKVRTLLDAVFSSRRG
jgi:hypothetical protein